MEIFFFYQVGWSMTSCFRPFWHKSYLICTTLSIPVLITFSASLAFHNSIVAILTLLWHQLLHKVVLEIYFAFQRTIVDAPPMARPAEDWGGCAVARTYVGSRSQPSNNHQQIHIHHSPPWERVVGGQRGGGGGGGGGGLLKQGQAVAISGWYSSCWPVIHTHSSPRLIIECPHNTSFKYPPHLKLKYPFISPKRNCFCRSIILIYVVMQSARKFLGGILLTTWSRSCSCKIYAVAVNHPG